MTFIRGKKALTVVLAYKIKEVCEVRDNIKNVSYLNICSLICRMYLVFGKSV